MSVCVCVIVRVHIHLGVSVYVYGSGLCGNENCINASESTMHTCEALFKSYFLR